MTNLTFNNIAVLGAGLMGSGIAEVALQAGSKVTLFEISSELLEKGKSKIEKSLNRKVEKGKIESTQAQAALANLTLSTNLKELGDAELIIEAITENFKIKSQVFKDLDEILNSDAIIASNTSSIPIMKLGASTKRAHQVVGMHFFNPVPVMPLVEVIHSLATDQTTIEKVTKFAQELGKTVIPSADRSGFVVNALLVPYLISAIRMVEANFATPESIDNGMKLGANHPMGPLELADFVGLDTTKFIADAMYEEYHDPNFAAPPLLCRMVEAGYFGRKSGKGFYDYSAS